jgi:soluble lytic murein transglycosylase
MRRYLLSFLFVILVVSLASLYFFNDYWIHRYDDLIARQAGVYRLDDKLVWSVIYEETWFRAWRIGADGEIGLMQVTPLVAREWARETGLKQFEMRALEEPVEFLRDPERNIQVGCWYLETLREKYRGSPAMDAMALAAYNAGPSRVEEWAKDADPAKLSEADFITRIGISSTKVYVTSILERYRATTTKRQ